MTTPPPHPSHDPLCAFCGGEVPTMEAIIYHGVVYHPACVALTTGREPHANSSPPGGRPRQDER